jgi:probable F420-dependent oxidoreductase
VEFGLYLPWGGPAATPENVASVAETAERLGYDFVGIAGHLVYPSEIRSRYPYTASGKVAMDPRFVNLDPLGTLAWVAGRTSRIGLQTRVLLLPAFSPFAVAKTVASLDYLSGGRVVLGLGSGWMKEEFDALGLPFERRGALLEESIQVLRTLWTDGGAHRGEFFSFADVYAAPRPAQDPLPIWLAASNTVTLRRAARVAQGILVAGGIAPDTAGFWHRLQRELEAAGRSRDGFRVSTEFEVHFEEGGGYGSLDYSTSRAPAERDRVLEALAAWRAVGSDAVNVGFGFRYDLPLDVLHERMQWFAEEVIPAAR